MNNKNKFFGENIENNEIKETLTKILNDVLYLRNEINILKSEINILKKFMKNDIENQKREEQEKSLEDNKNIKLSISSNSSDENQIIIDKLNSEKQSIESSFSKIKKNNDIIYEKVKSQIKRQYDLNNSKMNINDIFNILYEQKQVETKYIQFNFEIEKNRILSLDDIIITIRDKLNYVNEKVKNKIEELQDKIQLNFKALKKNELKDKKNQIEFEKILSQIKDQNIEYGKISNEFFSTGNEIEQLQNDFEKTLKEINQKIQKFLESNNNTKEEITQTPQKIKNSITEQLYKRSQLLKENNIIKGNFNENNRKENIINNSSNIEESEFANEVIDANEFFEPQLLKLNWKETCTIQSNGIKLIEVDFVLKAVGCKNQFYSTYTYLFNLNYNIEIIKVEMNHKEIKPNFSSHRLIFNFKLSNEETLPIRIIYKEIPINFKKYYNKILIGLPGILYGRKAYYTLIISEDLVVCKIENNFLKDKGNGKYIWEGVVPFQGITTLISITLKKFKWKIMRKINFFNESGIKNVHIITPQFCKGGNNKILSYNIRNNSIDKIDGKNLISKGDKIDSKYNNVDSSYGFLIFDIVLENFSNLEWECSKEIIIPKDEEENQIKLSTTAITIIEDDKSDDPIYIKIGKWVYNNIKYKLSLKEKKLKAIEILENKEGVCQHFTILYNALLNSIGIPAIYVNGYNLKQEVNKLIPTSHSWSIINNNGKWIGIDATWGLFNGILPINHIFFYYQGDEIHYYCHGKKENFLEESIINIEPFE